MRCLRSLCDEIVAALFRGGEQLRELRRASEVGEDGIDLEVGVGAIVSCNRAFKQPQRDSFLPTEGKPVCYHVPILGIRIRQVLLRCILCDRIHLRGWRMIETSLDHFEVGVIRNARTLRFFPRFG